MSQLQDSDTDDSSVRHETHSQASDSHIEIPGTDDAVANDADDDAWDDIEESLRFIFDAWNGSPLCGSEMTIYSVVRVYLG